MQHVRHLLALAASLFGSLCLAEGPVPKVLFDPAQPGAIGMIKPNETFGETAFTIGDNTVDVSVKAGGRSSSPGILITPRTPWDASGFGHVETTVTNTGTKPLRVNLRVDNDVPGQDAWNAEVVTIKPGQTKTLGVIMGYSYGGKGFDLRPEGITKAIVFIGKSDATQSFRVQAIRAAGVAGEKPYVDPNTVAAKPAGGRILGQRATFDPTRQLVARAGVKVAASSAESFTVSFPGTAKQALVIKPAAGMWNLSEHLQVRVRVRNPGSAPIVPTVQLESRGGSSEVFRSERPIAPGQEGEIIAPFIVVLPWKGVDVPEMNVADGPAHDFTVYRPGTGTKYTSNKTIDIVLSADEKAGPVTMQVVSIVADMPARKPLPEWLGKRPPVDGDWKLTFDDNFDGNTIDLKKWNLYPEGEWHLGKATGFSKDNVIVKDGKLCLRVEKRKVHHADSPAYPVCDYATGWCDSYGKWTQRYGYFEARVKLPAAPNQFVAFWMMPDRGLEYGADTKPAFGESRHLKRDSTNGLGMEIDIMEQLSIWGPNRHDFGCHWDFYTKNHKSHGTFGCYYQPDAEGFLTVGLLWTPGSLVMYQQGQEAARWESKRISSIPSYLILQHITGGWETDGMDDAQLPSDLVFDYVRAWQRKDLASSVDGPKPNDGGPLPPKQSGK